MNSWLVATAASILVTMAGACALRAARAARSARIVRVATDRAKEEGGGADVPGVWPSRGLRGRSWPASVLLCGAGAAAGWFVAGPFGGVMGLVASMGGCSARHRGRQRGRLELLEGQLGGVAESVSVGLRSGLSVVQALEFSKAEALQPIRAYLDRFGDEQRLGVPFEAALERLGEDLGTDDARFLVLVTGIHARSGGDLAGALDEVAQTIRHRVGVRRELRAASAQGRLSGLIMGSLPVAFFFFLSITSHRKLAPVLHSGPGMAMVGAGLVLEGLAYLWIRRLLQVEM